MSRSSGEFRDMWFFDRALSSVVFFLLHKAGGFPAISLTTFATIAADDTNAAVH